MNNNAKQIITSFAWAATMVVALLVVDYEVEAAQFKNGPDITGLRFENISIVANYDDDDRSIIYGQEADVSFILVTKNKGKIDDRCIVMAQQNLDNPIRFIISWKISDEMSRTKNGDGGVTVTVQKLHSCHQIGPRTTI